MIYMLKEFFFLKNVKSCRLSPCNFEEKQSADDNKSIDITQQAKGLSGMTLTPMTR